MHVIYPLAAVVFLVQLMLFVRLHLRGGYNLVSHAVSNYGVVACPIREVRWIS